MNDEAKKHYCYSDDCEIILTGFQIDQYWVCKKCKFEITEGLKQKIETRQKKGYEPISLDEYDDWSID